VADAVVVAVHQPTFLPWLGFFDKLSRADVFVVLDDVQFARGGHGNWVNRVKWLVDGRPAWATVPVKRSHRGLETIRSVEIADDVAWRSKLVNGLQRHYRHAAAFGEAMPYFADLLAFQTTSICEFNIHAIEQLRRHLRIGRPRVIRQSEIGVTGQATDLLVQLVRAAGGTAYLCGDGSTEYLETEAFSRAGLGLEFQRFAHPAYPQHGVSEFVSGLSIVDAAMQCGFASTARWFAA